MPGEIISGDGVESVTLRLANLEISISVRQIEGAPSVTTDFEVVSTAADPTPVDLVDSVVDPYGITLDLEHRAIRAQTAGELAGLRLTFLSHLATKLRGQHSEWTPWARIGRAFRAGIIARRRLDGVFLEEASTNIPFRNTYYVVLRGRGNSHGFWTTSYEIYLAGVRDQTGGPRSFHPDTISHAFASHAEAEAYLAGARRPWPVASLP